MGSARFRDQKHVLKKAFDTGLMKILDKSFLDSAIGAKAADALDAIEQDGDKFYRLGVDEGEAYSHAASLNLKVPILSNDHKALKVLAGNGVPLQETLLRAYDVLVFGVQIGNLSHNDCDELRQNLAKRGDGVHWCFRDRSFTNGLPRFYPRLIDGHHPVIGSNNPREPHDNSRLIVTPK